MTLNPITTVSVVAIVIAILAIVLALWALLELRKIRRLKSKFGPEYDRVVRTEGDPRHAETVLENREKRVSRYNVRTLTAQETERFALEWRNLQEQFVDNPRMAVAWADELIDEAMRVRGYPISDFEEQGRDLSVDYPAVVEHYRAAHAIDLRGANGRLDTEELRKAMRHYHALFEKVIESGTSNHHVEAR